MAKTNVCELQRLAENESGGWRHLSPATVALLGTAVEFLSRSYGWRCDGDELGNTESDWMEAALGTLAAEMSENMIGAIIPFFRTSLPDNILICDGSFYLEEDYPELYARVPESSKTTDPNGFVVPDLLTRYVAGTELGLLVGTEVGTNSMVLGIEQLPPHTHSYTAATPDFALTDVGVPTPAAGYLPAQETGSTGAGDPIDNRPLTLLMVYGIVAR